MARNIRQDLSKLSNAFFANLISEDDFVGLDAKRPFGNSAIESDVLEIIGWEAEGRGEGREQDYSQEQYDYANRLLYKGLIPYLQKTYMGNYSEWAKTKREASQELKSEETELKDIVDEHETIQKEREQEVEPMEDSVPFGFWRKNILNKEFTLLELFN